MQHTQLTDSYLIQLGEDRPGPCVSVFMPLRGIDTGVRNDQVRLSHLGDRALELMGHLHLRPEDSKKLVEPGIRRAIESARQWNRPGNSIALFISPAFSRSFTVPTELTEHVTVGPRFVTRPLMPLVELGFHPYLLALGLQGTHLYRVNHDRLETVELDDLPSGVEVVGQFENTENPEHYRAPGSGGRLFHGHGGDLDVQVQLRMEFLRLVAAAVTGLAQQERMVLALAGEATLLDDFRKAVTMVDIAEMEIHGSAERFEEAELFGRAWNVVLNEAAGRREQVAAEMKEQWSSSSIVKSVVNVLPMALQGRVRDLFIASDAETWGRVDEAGLVVEEQSHIRLASDDLLDLCAHHTLKNGGNVHVVTLASMPGGVEAGAAVARLRAR